MQQNNTRNETAALVPYQNQDYDRPGLVMPLVDAKTARQAVEQYEALKSAIVRDSDIQIIKSKDRDGRLIEREYLKKAFWRRVANCFGLSLVLESEERGFDEQKHLFYSVVYRAVAPNGRSMPADGYCSTGEKNKEYWPEHNVRATAHTRAKNRAISDLVGGGEVSAEEMQDDDTPPSPSKPTSPASPTNRRLPATRAAPAPLPSARIVEATPAPAPAVRRWPEPTQEDLAEEDAGLAAMAGAGDNDDDETIPYSLDDDEPAPAAAAVEPEMTRAEFLAAAARLNLNPRQVMERLKVRSLNGLNLRAALATLQAETTPADTTPEPEPMASKTQMESIRNLCTWLEKEPPADDMTASEAEAVRLELQREWNAAVAANRKAKPRGNRGPSAAFAATLADGERVPDSLEGLHTGTRG